MELNEKAIDYLEEFIPELAEQAFRQAYLQTLASGDTVLVAEDGKIMEVFPDGSRRFVKEIAKPTIVQQRHFTIPKV